MKAKRTRGATKSKSGAKAKRANVDANADTIRSGDALASARAAIASGDHAAAVAHLLAAWRETRDPATAALVGKVGKLAAHGIALPSNKKRDELAAGDDPADVDVLLASLGEGVVEKRMVGLLMRAPDPRIANACADRLENFFSQKITPWKAPFAALVAAGDPATVNRLPAIAKRGPWLVERLNVKVRDAFRTSFAKLVANAREALAEIPTHKPDRAALAAIETALASSPSDCDPAEEAALLGEIYADPKNDGPRVIYADWLIERGDVRGEFINLQLRMASYVRIKNLLAQHEKAWLGSLAEYVSDADFKRGFPATATVNERDGAFPEAAAWATVEEVHCALPASDANPMPVLETATALSPIDLVRLAAMTRPPPLVTIEVFGDNSPDAALTKALAKLRVPTLRDLSMRLPWPDPVEAVALLSAIAPLEKLEVTSGSDDLAAWLTALCPTTVVRFEAKSVQWGCTGKRDKQGDPWRISTGYGANTAASLGQIIDVMMEMPPKSVAALDVRVAKSTWTLALRKRVASAIERHPAIEEVDNYSPP